MTRIDSERGWWGEQEKNSLYACVKLSRKKQTNKLKEQNQFPITASCERNVILTVWGKFKSLYTYSHIMLKWFRVKALDTWNKQEKLSLFWKTVNMVFGLSSFPLWECGVRGCTQLSQDYMPRKSVLSIQIYLLPKTLIFVGHHFFSSLRFGKCKYYEKVHKSCSEAIVTTVMWPVSFQLRGPIILFWFFPG